MEVSVGFQGVQPKLTFAHFSDVFRLKVDLEAKYRKSWRRFIALEQRLYASLLATADVFCATAIGSSASKVMSVSDVSVGEQSIASTCA